jgi:hypothetical protein
LDVDEGAIEDVVISKGESSFQLHRTGDNAWDIIEGDARESADADTVADVLIALVDLRADDLSFPEARVPGDVFGTVSMTLDDESTLSMTVERSPDGMFSVTRPDTNAVYSVSATRVSKIFAEPGELKPEPSAESPEDADPPAADAATEAPEV